MSNAFFSNLSELPSFRAEDPVPHAFRFAEYPCGAKRLQGAYAWREGFDEHGVVWRDLPVVKVDENGVAL